MSVLLTLSEIKLHLRVTDTGEDDIIEIYADAAEDWIKKFTNRTTLPDNGDSPVTYPHAVKASALLIIADLYANREAGLEKPISVNPALERLLYPYRESIGI